MGFLRPKTSVVATNVNNKALTSAYSPAMQQGNQAMGAASALLTGQGDTAGAQQGYNNYLQMAGYAPAMRQLSQSVTGQGAASGLLNSGATAKALQTRGAELNQGYFNNYLQNLGGLTNQGLQAGGLVANAGQGQVVQKPSLLGSIASAVGGIGSVLANPAGFAAGTIGAKIFGK